MNSHTQLASFLAFVSAGHIQVAMGSARQAVKIAGGHSERGGRERWAKDSYEREIEREREGGREGGGEREEVWYKTTSLSVN